QHVDGDDVADCEATAVRHGDGAGAHPGVARHRRDAEVDVGEAAAVPEEHHRAVLGDGAVGGQPRPVGALTADGDVVHGDVEADPATLVGQGLGIHVVRA